jgi:hypothetical protein
VAWTNLSNDPTALQIYVYGQNNGSNTVSFSGNAAFRGVLYAPQSTVRMSGNATFYGALSASQVNLSGNGFNWDSRAGSLQASSTGLYYRTAWAHCTPIPTVTAQPGSGCS